MKSNLENLANKASEWVGSVPSMIIHTLIFVAAFLTILFGVPFATVLLWVTTIVSLEAIYLSIFVQFSVNQQKKQITEHGENIDDLHEKIDSLNK